MIKRVLATILAFLFCFCAVPASAEDGGQSALPAEESVPVSSLNHLSHELPIWAENATFTKEGIVYNNNELFYNASDNTYQTRASVVYSYLTELSDGGFLRVEPKGYNSDYDRAHSGWYRDPETGEYKAPVWADLKFSEEDALIAETYSKELVLTDSKEIPFELPLFGGFFYGKDYNFVVFGQNNPDCSDSAEVIRIVKYDKTWNRVAALSVYGANTSIPFDAGSLRMVEASGLLYIHTCHEMYSGHQANMTFVVDQQSMTMFDQMYHVMNISIGYSSHSFNEFIATDGTYIYRVDHGDAYPRSVVVTRCAVGGDIEDVIYADAFDITQGSLGENYTGVSVGGFALGDSSMMIAGNSVDQTNEDTYYDNKRNVFISVMGKDLQNANTVWLTDYDPEGTLRPGTPHLVKLSGDRFLVLWEEYDSSARTFEVCSITVDSSGTAVSDVVRNPYRLSDCQPILCSDGTVKWYVSYNNKTLLYSLDPQKTKPMITVGDVNGDGFTDNIDAAYVLRYDAGISDLTETQKIAADVNGDGEVDSMDSAAILKYEAGLISRVDE